MVGISLLLGQDGSQLNMERVWRDSIESER